MQDREEHKNQNVKIEFAEDHATKINDDDEEIKKKFKVEIKEDYLS